MPPSWALSRLQLGGSGGRALLDVVPWRLQHKRCDTEDCVSDDDSDNESMTLTSPSEPPSDERNAPDDCHVLIRWSQLQNLVKQRMACAHCGLPVATFERRTVGIATEINFSCSVCKAFETARALRTDYVVNDSMETDP
jgi:C1A family cysteine protease